MRWKGIHPVASQLLAAALILFYGSAAGFVIKNASPAHAANLTLYTLYLPAAGSGNLVSLTKNLPYEKDRTETLTTLAKALLSNEPAPTETVIPLQLSLRRVFLDRAGTAYVDLDAPSGRPLVSDAAMERLHIWSIVNTLCYNFSDVQQVKVLVGGDEAETLSGHIDLSRPLLPDPRLIEKDDR
jgi:hypothetical protein